MAKKKDKMEVVITALLARLTDFQLQSNLDEDFFNNCEELRQYLVDYNKKEK